MIFDLSQVVVESAPAVLDLSKVVVVDPSTSVAIGRGAHTVQQNEFDFEPKVEALRQKQAAKPAQPVLETITPALAAEYLALNRRNCRPLKPKVVERYADLMSRGQWISAHNQGIAFDSEGYLGDGQHRLSAVVRSGVSISMWVAYGCPVEDFLVTDEGAKRSDGDRIRLQGIAPGADHKRLAAAMRCALIGINRYKKSDIPSDQVVRFAKDHAELLCRTISMCQGMRPYRSEVVAAYLAATFEFDEAKVAESAQRLASNNLRGRGDPLGALKDCLIRTTSNVVLPSYITYARCVSAIRADLEGRALVRIHEADQDFANRPWADLKLRKPRGRTRKQALPAAGTPADSDEEA